MNLSTMYVLAKTKIPAFAGGTIKIDQSRKASQLVMMANCGFPERSQFQVNSHWLKRHARNLNAQIIDEIYVPQGALLSVRDNDQGIAVANCLKAVKTACREIAIDRKLTPETQALLKQKFIPDEVYIREVKKSVDSLLVKQDDQ